LRIRRARKAAMHTKIARLNCGTSDKDETPMHATRPLKSQRLKPCPPIARQGSATASKPTRIILLYYCSTRHRDRMCWGGDLTVPDGS
jgi:hypothetical protein